MQHDIYSLGVILLEIGLWTSLVLSDPSQLPIPSSILSAEQTLPTAAKTKQRLEYLAETKLPQRLGRRYTDIVLLCLRCLDPGNEMDDEDETGFDVDTGDFTDEDGIVIGVRFIENVLKKMQEITM